MKDTIKDNYLISFESYKEGAEDFMVIRIFNKEEKTIITSCVCRPKDYIDSLHGKLPVITLKDFFSLINECASRLSPENPLCVNLSRWKDGALVSIESGVE